MHLLLFICFYTPDYWLAGTNYTPDYIPDYWLAGAAVPILGPGSQGPRLP